MPRAHPPAFRRRAVELARVRTKPIAQLASDLGISESCLRAGRPDPTSRRATVAGDHTSPTSAGVSAN